MVHAQSHSRNSPSEHNSLTPGGHGSIPQPQTPSPRGRSLSPDNPPSEPGSNNDLPRGPGGPDPGPPDPNPPVPPPPPPVAPDVAPAVPNKKKSHVKKPEDFEDAKQWDHYRRQTFVYIQENAKDFTGDKSVVRFLLSFMTGGLPEKFAANFIDDLMEDSEERRRLILPGEPKPIISWGTADDFYEKCDETFGNQNKRPNAEHQLALLHQGTKTAEEYFQEFDQLVRTAKYQVGHNNILIKYLHEQVKTSVIDNIYAVGKLPRTYNQWKEAILNINGLEQQ
jgi:hypothetical protein